MDGEDDCSSTQRREKGMSSKTSFPCHQFIKGYNKGMRGVDHIDHLTSTCRLERRSKTRYYLLPFFDLWDMALVNAYIVYGELTLKKLSHLDFQVILAKSLIGNYNNQRRNPEKFRTTERVSSKFPTKTPSHFPELEPSRSR